MKNLIADIAATAIAGAVIGFGAFVLITLVVIVARGVYDYWAALL